MVKTLLKAVLRQAGYEVKRTVGVDGTPVGTEERRLAMIRRNGINVVLDVGANVGHYAMTLRKGGFVGKILSFEPLADAFNELKKASDQDRNWDVFNFAIGAKDGDSTINVAGLSTSSSILPMLPKHLEYEPESRYESAQSVRVRRLDSLLPNIVSSKDRLFLKIDTQGFEREVLTGMSSIFPQVHLIECELSLTPLYADAPLFLEMVGLLNKNGFRPVYFHPGISEKTGYCLQVDGWFARNQ